MTKYFNEILIVGPSVNLTLDIQALYNTNDRIIIGNGQKLSYKNLKMIEKSIGPDTRIDIIGHGNTHQNNHVISLFKETINTEKIISKIGTINKNPKHIHLWSCFGGAANKAITKLPSGSILITHSPEDDSIFINDAFQSLIKSLEKRTNLKKSNQYSSPIQEYIEAINHNVLQNRNFK